MGAVYPFLPEDDSPLGTSRPESSAPESAAGLFSPAELQYFHDLLLTSRNQLIAEIERLEREMRAGDTAAAGFRPVIAGQGYDRGDESIWEHMTSLRCLTEKKMILRDIEQAILRVNTGRYGRCIIDAVPIDPELLEDVPWIKYCKACLHSGRVPVVLENDQAD